MDDTQPPAGGGEGGAPRRLNAPRVFSRESQTGSPIPPARDPAVERWRQNPRPTDVVGEEDNPLTGWRGYGLKVLGNNIWPNDATRNPVFVYFAGRTAGRSGEDFAALIPWIVFSIASAVVGGAPPAIGKDVILGALVLFFLGAPVAGAFATVLVVTSHIRSNIARLPLEELVLTRLRPADVVQGLSIRPMAVTSFGVMMLTLSGGLGFGWAFFVRGSPMMVAVSLVVMVVTYYWCMMLCEAATCQAARANLVIRDGGLAFLRAMWDLAGGIAVVAFASGILVLAGLGTCVGVLLVPPALVTVAMAVGMVRVGAREAVHYAERHWRLWWCYEPLAGENPLNASQMRLVTPWDRLVKDLRAQDEPLRRQKGLRGWLPTGPPRDERAGW